VFILDHNFASKLFAAVYEAFSNLCADKEVPNKTTVHQMVTTFQWMLIFEMILHISNICCKTVLQALPSE
jgi:flagellar biosynthesis protein FliR